MASNIIAHLKQASKEISRGLNYSSLRLSKQDDQTGMQFLTFWKNIRLPRQTKMKHECCYNKPAFIQYFLS